MAERGLPDCVGSACEVCSFDLTEITAESYCFKDPITGLEVTKTTVPPDVAEAFEQAIRELYRPYSKSCGKDCVCAKIEKVLGPTEPGDAKTHAHVFPSGARVEGTYKVSTTVYRGVCVPVKTTSGKTEPEPERPPCCPPYHAYYRRYGTCPPYWDYWSYWRYRGRWW